MPSCVMDSPVGRLMLTERDGCLCGLTLSPGSALSAPDTPLLQQAVQELTEYFAGVRREFDLPLRADGTVFQQQCWAALRAIPYGETRTYAQQAQAVGNPKACRAVGGANHRNPIAIVIPCHRVVGANGALTGYACGTEMKAWLLAHEKRHGAS